MKIVTEKDLVNIFLNLPKNNQAISLKTKSVLKLKKTSRKDFLTIQEKFNTNSIYKISENVVHVNTIYDNSVNNRREKEGMKRDFVSEKLPYGEYVNDSRIVFSHKENYYIRTYQTNSKLGKASLFYKESGELLSKDQVKILKEEYMSETPEYIESQELSYEKSCKPTNYAVSGILNVTINGENYEVKH